jgi:hypothetical protein
MSGDRISGSQLRVEFLAIDDEALVPASGYQVDPIMRLYSEREPPTLDGYQFD